MMESSTCTVLGEGGGHMLVIIVTMVYNMLYYDPILWGGFKDTSLKNILVQ